MSLQDKFTGTGIAIVTPFNEDGTIDWDNFKRLLQFWIDGQVEYLVVLGTTGESPTIHGSEKQEVFSFVKDSIAGRLPLIAGIGGNDTKQVLKDLKEFNLEGYDAILSVSPSYNKPNQEGIFQHYKNLDEATPLPIMLYNVPSRTGQNVTADTQLRIARECKNIFATKEASGNFDQLHQILRNKPEDFMVISGDDGITLPMIAAGGAGVISVVANAYPQHFSTMVRFCLEGNFEQARIIHYNLTEVIQSMFEEGSPSGVKAYLSEMKLCRNTVRLPIWPVSDGLLQKIRMLMGSVE